MECFRSFLLVLIFLSSPLTGLHHHDEHDEHGEDAFHVILSAMKLNNSLKQDDVDSILTRIGVRNCSHSSRHNHKCIHAETLFRIHNISGNGSVDEKQFEKFAPLIVYSLLPNEHNHDEDHKKENHNEEKHEHGGHHEEHSHSHDHEIMKDIHVYEKLLERYHTKEICESIIDQLLNDVNKSSGERLSGKKCFSSHDILHKLNISHDMAVTKPLLRELSVVIISKLIEGNCIEVEHLNPIPCSSYFVHKLFDQYSTNETMGKENLEKLMKKLSIVPQEAAANNDHHDHSNDHGHNHGRRRRSLDIPKYLSGSEVNQKSSERRYRRAAGEHEQHEQHQHQNVTDKYKKCYSADELFTIYNVNKNVGFKMDKFQLLTSALVNQVESAACVGTSQASVSKSKHVSDKEKWGYGFLAVAIISLCSVFGVAVIPIMNSVLYQKVIVFFISLAVGTLVGDAMLHLLPHATGFHNSHNHESGSSHGHENESRDYLWKFLAATGAIYAFFLFETLTHLFLQKPIGHSHSFEHTRRHSQISTKNHGHRPDEVGVESIPRNGDPSVKLTNMAYVPDEESGPKKSSNGVGEKKDKVSRVDVFDPSSTYAGSIEEKKEVKKTIGSVAWMIIIGDTIHNVADGIAIGVAFSAGTSVGVSTAIAVFCHELPHELGDFAVLLTAGMSVKMALLANFLSACSCFLGLVFGILISDVQNANQWIFAVTAGFFIYIALTDMLPELMSSSEFPGVTKRFMFFLQNLGMLTGFGIMLLLSYYEEDINV